ncbi:M3 family metallopeptidase [Taylorella equigenitalis]|uniref:oligopeptidase A n=1 Tax=Taylorella equigenitalis (strain MCE9) TaxID=937774 RepID=A0A654KIK5_TAYEM|nr:M3 family metallopeptidase [Taylorella equigenitalis]ADU92297.1 Oligopeptidase A [Taylorella equigenitalis MCE9]WDU50078.1 M3 family metallopeptidase [Taylorella equigenitalis]WDU57042.1 M3 family metallopeptidase [Taylorella equigenitalis]
MLTYNPLLVDINEFIDYKSIEPQHVEPAITYLIEENQKFIDELVSKEAPLTWNTFIHALNQKSAVLFRAWQVVGHLNAVVNSPELREAYTKTLPLISLHTTMLGLNRNLYKHYKDLADESANPEYSSYSDVQKRILKLALHSFKQSGVELEGEKKQKFIEISEKLAQLSQKFSENCLDSVDKWSYFVSDLNELKGLPEDVISLSKELAKAENRPDEWKLVLQIPVYLPVMKYADSEALRERLYRGYNTIASENGISEFDNSAVIEEILHYKNELAKILDYKDFADYQLQTRMAKNSDTVMNFLNDLSEKSKPFAEKDLKELKEFVKTEFNKDELNPWDYPYYSEKLRQSKYSYSDSEIKKYLPVNSVFEGWKSIISKLFNVQLIPKELHKWHDDVVSFEITDGDNEEVLGHLYVDLYARNGKQSGAWVNLERDRMVTESLRTTPIVYLTCNFMPPVDGKPSLLTHDDVVTLFHETGHALHALLTKVDEVDASAFHSVEWDAIELPSQMMENFVWERDVVNQLSSHFETKEKLPDELFEKLIRAKNFQSGFFNVRQLEFALFDMQLHMGMKELKIADVLRILNEVRTKVAVIMPPEWARFPHNFSHIFAGGYSAGYYSYKWAEVLSSDVYSLFEENRLPNGSTVNPEVGAQYRKKILEVGGSKPAEEFFRDFRGRNPKPDAMLRHQGLI